MVLGAALPVPLLPSPDGDARVCAVDAPLGKDVSVLSCNAVRWWCGLVACTRVGVAERPTEDARPLG